MFNEHPHIKLEINKMNHTIKIVEKMDKINEIKQLRLEVDGLAQLTKELKPIEILPSTGREVFKNANETIEIGHDGVYFNSAEIEKAVDSLYLAKAWLGKLLEELGNTSPYGTGYKTKEDIIPTQDVNQDIHGYNLDVVHFEDKNHIEKVVWLREEIKSLSVRVKNIDFHSYDSSSTSYKHLCEARFWLGFELQRIKEGK